MMHIKNIRLIKVLDGESFYYIFNKKQPGLKHLQILRSLVYIFIHEEKQILKPEKWASQTLFEQYIEYNGHIIYKIFIKK